MGKGTVCKGQNRRKWSHSEARFRMGEIKQKNEQSVRDSSSSGQHAWELEGSTGSLWNEKSEEIDRVSQEKPLFPHELAMSLNLVLEQAAEASEWCGEHASSSAVYNEWQLERITGRGTREEPANNKEFDADNPRWKWGGGVAVGD